MSSMCLSHHSMIYRWDFLYKEFRVVPDPSMKVRSELELVMPMSFLLCPLPISSLRGFTLNKKRNFFSLPVGC